MAPITGISGLSLPGIARTAGTSTESSGGAFQDVLSNAIQSVESVNKNASASVERFLSGEGEELHTTILATQKAELSFDLFLQMRNKVVNAYQDIMRMQI